MRVADLSEPERRLWMGFPYGTHVDLRTGDAERDDPANASSWEPDRIIRAEVIKDLLVGRYPADEQRQREEGEGRSPAVFLSGARITGALDLRGLDVSTQLLLQACAFDEPLILADSMCRSVRLYGCHLPGVQGAWLVSDGSLHLRNCHIHDIVDLTGAFIGRQLVLSGSQLSGPGGVAISADGLVVMGDMLCRDGAVVKGEVSLVAARIGGELRFTDSTLLCPGGIALRADRIAVEKDMHCRESFRAEGQVRLQGGHIKGQLNLNNATLSNPGKVALDADQIVVDSHLYCQEIQRDKAEQRGEAGYDETIEHANPRFKVDGGISLVAARIGGEVRFSASQISNPGRVALRANRLVVTDNMFCREGLDVDGEIDLRGAHINGQLNFNNATLNNEHGVALRADGLVVDEHLYCQDNFNVTGGITLVAARIGGEVRFSASQISNPGRVALQADRLFVAEDMFCREGLEVHGEIDLRGAHIQGQLNFNNATLINPGRIALDADQMTVGSHLYCQQGFRAEGEVRMVAARVGGEVRFSASTLSNPGGVALRANRLVVNDNMFCREELDVRGEIDLRGAHIKGQLSFSTATVRNPQGTAIRASQLAVGSHLNCSDGFTADGLVDLTDAHVIGELSLSGATLSNADRVALLAPRLIVDNTMICRDDFAVDGTMCLIGAHVGGDLSLSNARLVGASLTDEQLAEAGISQMLSHEATVTEERSGQKPPGRFLARLWHTLFQDIDTADAQPPSSDPIVIGKSGLALVADGLHVDGNMTCHALNALGEVRLNGARIAKNLDFTGAEVNNEGGTALDAANLQAERIRMPARCDEGKISLRYGTLTELDDKHGVVPEQIDMVGLTYERLLSPIDPQRRLKWMRQAGPYEPQPYDQLARSYRQLGHDESARMVELEQERRRRDTLPLVRKWWGYLQDATVGYGYRPMRAAVLLGSIVLVGAIGFAIYPPQSADPHAVFNPFLFTVDVIVPVWDFGQSAWTMNVPQEWFMTALIAIFWLSASTVIVAYAERKV